jgi:two-component system alkaline phosphatase synthesis response regulator PhoP
MFYWMSDTEQKPTTHQRATILVVEDEPQLLQSWIDYLDIKGYRALGANCGKRALELGMKENPDIIMMDWMLPDIQGDEVVEKLRASGFLHIIVMLTCRGDIDSKLRGLNRGADDYWVKPISYKEVLARIEAMLRRRFIDTVEETQINLGKTKIDFSLRRVTAPGCDPIELNLKESEILKFLYLAKGKVVSRNDLLASVWKFTYAPNSRTVDNYIVAIRKKIEPDAKHPIYLRTVHGGGYILHHKEKA